MNHTALPPAIALHGALFVCCAFVVWWCLRRQSAARVAAGVRILMAATLLLAASETGLAVWKSRQPESAVSAMTAEPPLPQQAGGVSAVLLVTPATTPATVADLSHQPAAAPAAVARRWELSPPAAVLLSILWLAGSALVLMRWMFALLARRRLVRGASLMPDAACQALLQQTPCGSGVKLLLHPGRVVPCAWGRTILLPAEANDWPPAQRRMVLAHECAHLRRRDPFWLAVSQCFLALQWFNPLAWAAVKNYRLASERAADDAVLVATQDAPAYAGLLVACARVRAALPPVLCAMASPSTVGQRVEHILNEAADRRRAGVLWPAAWVAAFHLVAAGVLWISPVLAIAQEPVAEAPAEPPLPPDAGPAPATDPGADLRNAFESKVVRQVQWSDTLLSHALKELHEKTGVNFILRGDEDKKLTLHLREAPLREVISAMCEATGMQFDPQETAVVISPAAAPLMETRTFLLPDKLAAEISDNGSANKLLEQAGILAAEGSLVSFEPASHRLIAKNTRHELERIENWVETGRADAAFAWTPVKLEQREYVSAHKVRRFYGFTSFQPGEGEAQDTILFKSPVLHMQWRKDSPDILIHGAKFVLQLPIREHEGTL